MVLTFCSESLLSSLSSGRLLVQAVDEVVPLVCDAANLVIHCRDFLSGHALGIDGVGSSLRLKSECVV